MAFHFRQSCHAQKGSFRKRAPDIFGDFSLWVLAADILEALTEATVGDRWQALEVVELPTSSIGLQIPPAAFATSPAWDRGQLGALLKVACLKALGQLVWAATALECLRFNQVG